MGLKCENYNRPIRLFYGMIWIGLGLIFISFQASGQGHQTCSIKVAHEPELGSKAKSPSSIKHHECDSLSAAWSNEVYGGLSDNQYVSVVLNSKQESHCLWFNDFGMHLPERAQISGLQIIIEGHVEGEEGSVLATQIQLTNQVGTPFGDNKFKSVLWGRAWEVTADSSDVTWIYGYSQDDWGIALHEALYNNPNFGLMLQLANQSSQVASAYIDRVQMKIYYTPVYTLCNHDCITFFVPEKPGTINYNWKMPPGFAVLSGTVVNNTINISAIGDQKGYHQICINMEDASGKVETCCRQFFLDNCTVAGIGDFVWLDANANGKQDEDEAGISDIQVNLFDETDQLVTSTVTDAFGRYFFADIQKGYYYLKLAIPDQYKLSFKNVDHPSDLDSDFTNDYGPGTSTLFEILPGESNTDLDFGLYSTASLGNFVWHDINANGLQDDGEEGISGIELQLFDAATNELIKQSTTNNEGFYQFDSLYPGAYVVIVNIPVPYVITKQMMGDSINSDFDSLGVSREITLSSGEENLLLDAGMYKRGLIGDYVWFDANNDGIQDVNEEGLAGLEIMLTDSSGNSIDIAISDESGHYLFDQLDPGTYWVKFGESALYKPTLPDAIEDDELDSDVSLFDGKITTETIILNSCDSLLFIDAGFVFKPSSISGLTWEDGNGDGKRDPDEPALTQIVILKSNEGSIIQETNSGSEGRYSFSELAPGNYYVYFGLPQEYIFTSANSAPDSLDSDVTGLFEPGSTAEIALGPGEDVEFVDAGYILNLGSISGTAWIDLNSNDMLNPEDSLVGFVEVSLYDNSDRLISSTMTMEDGRYEFPDVLAGEYYLKFSELPDYEFVLPDVGPDDMDSDVTGANGTGATDVFVLAPGGNSVVRDAGYRVGAGTISGRAWVDSNRNGIYDNGENGLEAVLVLLFNQNDELVDSDLTNDFGEYNFPEVTYGMYYLQFESFTGFEFTNPNIGNDESDSDLTEVNGMGTSDSFTMNDGNKNIVIDGGYLVSQGNISGVTWIDLNSNDMLNPEDSLIDFVEVSLYDNSDQLISSTITMEDGRYEFPDVVFGEYYLKFSELTNYEFVLPDVGSDETDSDVTGANGAGSTDGFVLDLDESPVVRDAGYRIGSGTINGRAWLDSNRNGIYDNGENGLLAVLVLLFDQHGELVDSDFTNDFGEYNFPEVTYGMYYLQFESFTGFEFTSPNIGNDEFDSDLTEVNGIGTSDTFTMNDGNKNIVIDGGYLVSQGSISGLVWEDINQNGLREEGEPRKSGIVIQLYSSNDFLIAETTTDQEGAYFFDEIQTGEYYIVVELSDPYQFTIADEREDGAIDSDITGSISEGSTDLFTLPANGMLTNIDAGIFEKMDETITLGDLVWHDLNGNGLQDNDEPGIDDVNVTLKDQSGIVIAMTSTAVDTGSMESGYYQFTAIDPGDYYLEFELPEGFEFTLADQGDNDLIDSDVNGSNGEGATEIFSLQLSDQALHMDAGMFQKVAIGDYVWGDGNFNGIQDPFESGINNIRITLFNDQDEEVDQLFSETNDSTGLDGFYKFKTMPGSYYLKFDLQAGLFFTEPDIGDDDEIDSDVNSENGFSTTPIFMLQSGEAKLDLDAGMLQQPGSIGDHLWLDINADGIFDPEENGVNNIQVKLYRMDGVLIDSTLTLNDAVSGSAGFYLFENVPAGSYFIEFIIPENYLISPSNQGDNDAKDSDIINAFGRGTTAIFSIDAGEEDLDIDGGIYLPATMGDFVWFDQNQNGIQDTGEEGVSGVEVILFASNNMELASDTTDQNGNYGFKGLAQGLYFVKFGLPDEFQFTNLNQGSDESKDSDVLPNGTTPLVSLAHAVDFEDLDAGLIPAQSLVGSRVWHDINGDGLQTPGEEGIKDVRIEIYTDSGEMVEFGHSDIEGTYLFTDLTTGEYKLKFIPPENYNFTDMDRGNNEALDSDVNSSGWTEEIYISAEIYHKHIDAGLFKTANLLTTIWNDSDANGVKDIGEYGLPDVKVSLMGSSHQKLRSANSIAFGNNKIAVTYFDDLRPGDYYLIYEPGKSGMVSTIPYANPGTSSDSDVLDLGEEFITKMFSIRSGENILDLGAGFYKGGVLGDKAWLDLDQNGIQSSYEPGLPDIPVYLFDENGMIVDQTNTDPDGIYEIHSIKKGIYYLRFDIKGNYTFSYPHMRGLDNMDSDVTHDMGWGTTSLFQVVPGYSNYNMDAGIMTGVLAIDDASLMGSNKGLYNELIIKPLNEINIESFEIEKSKDALEFTTLTVIQATGESPYTYRDFEIAEGAYFYRLKEIDKDGNIQISPIISIRVEKGVERSIVVYPNPASEKISVIVPGSQNVPVSLEIYTMTGALVHRYSLAGDQAEKQIGSFDLDIRQLAAGEYVLRCEVGERIHTTKFLVGR